VNARDKLKGLQTLAGPAKNGRRRDAGKRRRRVFRGEQEGPARKSRSLCRKRRHVGDDERKRVGRWSSPRSTRAPPPRTGVYKEGKKQGRIHRWKGHQVDSEERLKQHATRAAQGGRPVEKPIKHLEGHKDGLILL